MTEIARPRRYRRTARTLSALRQLAREAAEAGEPLAAIAARLDIPPTTLSDWALADGFRKTDLKAKAAAAAAAETEADRVRREAEEMVREAGLDAGASPVKREVDMARARVGALLDAGHIPEAEADMRKARRLLSLMNFAAPMQGRGRVWTDEDLTCPSEWADWDAHTRMAWLAGDHVFAATDQIRDHVWELEEAGQGEAFHALRRDLYARYCPRGQPPLSAHHAEAFYRKAWWLDPPDGGAPAGERRPATRIGYWDDQPKLSPEEERELVDRARAVWEGREADAG